MADFEVTFDLSEGDNLEATFGLEEGDDIQCNFTIDATQLDYKTLENKPSINDVTLIGNKTSADLGLQPSGDYATNTDLNTEIQNRISADNTLQTNINSEATERSNSDTLLQNNINTLSLNLNTEISNRESADETLQTQITSNTNNFNNYRTSANQDIIDNSIKNDITTINDKIPTQASSTNQLADKDFVNSSISSETANFVGTFNTLEELEAVENPTNNDYGFVKTTDSAGNTVYNRYKYNAKTKTWNFEYALNNSSFTVSQWAAINSGATSEIIASISDKADKSELDNYATKNELDTTKQAIDEDILAINEQLLTKASNDRVEAIEDELPNFATQSQITTIQGDISHLSGDIVDLNTNKQDKLVSGTNIKTINNQSLLGSGNITIEGGGGTSDYNALNNRPQINSVTLTGNKSLDDLGIQAKGDYATNTQVETTISEHNTSTTAHEDIREKIKDIELFKFPNAIIVGNPTIQSGQVSGFSVNNYMQFPFVVDVRDKSFEIDFCFTTGNNVTTQQNILDSKFGLALAISNGKGLMAMSSNGTNWDIGTSSGTYTINANTTYYAKVSWDGSTYTTALSTDGETYTTDMTLSSTKGLYPTTIYIGGGSSNALGRTPNPFFGSIDFNKCYLYIAELLIWQGMDDAGLATRADVSLSNLDSEGLAKITYTEGDNITIEDNIISATVPTKTSELTNDSGYITSSYHDSTKQDVISDLSTIRSGAELGATAIQPNDNISELNNDSGYITDSYHDATKYDASNPNGYTSNVGTVTSVNNVSPTNGNVTIDIPDVSNFITKDVSDLTNYTKTDDLGMMAFADKVTNGDIDGTINQDKITNLSSTLSGKQDTISDLATIRSNATNGESAYTTISGYGNIVTHNASEFYSSTNPSGYTSNTGTITGITMNGASKGTSGVVDLGTVITDISGKANTDLDNISDTGKKVIDGQWTVLDTQYTVYSGSLASTTALAVTIPDTILPSDNYNYELLLNGTARASSSAATILVVSSDYFGTSVDDGLYLSRAGTNYATIIGNGVLPIGTSRTIYIKRASAYYTGAVNIMAYRRLGTNS